MNINFPITSLLVHKTSALWHIAPEATVFEAIKLMAEKGIGALLVMSGQHLVGVFSERDYARKVALQGKTSRDTRVGEVISSVLVVATPEDSVEDCMRHMTESRVRHLPVVEGDQVVGIISIGDLVNWIISTQSAQIEQMEQYISGRS